MVAQKATQVGAFAAIMMICFDARYLLVNLDGGNEGDLNEIFKPSQIITGNIVSNLGLKNIKDSITNSL